MTALSIVAPGRFAQLTLLFLTIIVSYFFIRRAKEGKMPEIKRLPALDAIEEGVGRCIEMGRYVHFSLGTRALLTNAEVLPQTLAGLSVLSYVARLTARLGGDLVNSVCGGQIVQLCQDTIREAYIMEGKGDEYRNEMVEFVAEAPNSYQTGLMEVFARKNPGCNVFVGGLGGESLYLVECGNISGAVNIGGTARTVQLPFVVAGSDYFLIGEEIFAAGAYLNQDRNTLGSIQSEDIIRYICIALILIGGVLLWMGNSLVITYLKS